MLKNLPIIIFPNSKKTLPIILKVMPIFPNYAQIEKLFMNVQLDNKFLALLNCIINDAISFSCSSLKDYTFGSSQ